MNVGVLLCVLSMIWIFLLILVLYHEMDIIDRQDKAIQEDHEKIFNQAFDNLDRFMKWKERNNKE